MYLPALVGNTDDDVMIIRSPQLQEWQNLTEIRLLKNMNGEVQLLTYDKKLIELILCKHKSENARDIFALECKQVNKGFSLLANIGINYLWLTLVL